MDMEELTEAVERLRGAMQAESAFINALLRTVPPDLVEPMEAGYLEEVGALRAELRDCSAARATLEAFEIAVQQGTAKLDALIHGPRGPRASG